MPPTQDLATATAALTATIDEKASENNSFFLLWAGGLVFLMQAGFATLSAGSIRSKNVKNILLKNLLDACMGAITWYFIGYGIAYELLTPASDADNANGFIGRGKENFALSGLEDTGAVHAHGNDWTSWYFQFAFAAAASTIVSGAVAVRCALVASLIYTCFITGLYDPVTA